MRYKNEIWLFFFIFVLLQIAMAEVKEIELESGYKLTLEPTSEIDFVVIQIMLDKTKCLSKIEDLVYSELVLQSIKSNLEELPGIINILPLQYRPEHPYNWREHRFLIHKIKKEDFAQKVVEITSFLNNKLRISNRSISDLLFERSKILADSIQYTAEDFLSIKEVFAKIESITRLDVQNFFSEKDLTNCVNIYIYGDFNPLDILPDLAISQTNEQTSFQEKIINNSLPRNDAEISEIKGNLYLKIPIAPVSPESIIANAFLVDYLDAYLSLRYSEAQIRYYTPWSFERTYLTIIIENSFQNKEEFDSLLILLSELNNIKKETLYDWYYSKYVTKIEWLFNNLDEYLINRQLSKLYFYNYETMFRIYYRDSLSFNKVYSMLNEFLNPN